MAIGEEHNINLGGGVLKTINNADDDPELLVKSNSGGAVTVADAADVTQGAKADTPATVADATAFSIVAVLKGLLKVLGFTTDTAVATDANGTVNAHLRGIITILLTFVSAGVKLLAGENHVGEVGGYKRSASCEFARPADSTAYAVLDVIAPAALTVSAASNATPIVVTTGTHGLTDGDAVTIASVGGNTNANGNFFVKVTTVGSSTTFGLYSDAALTTPIAGNSAYTSGGTVIKLLRFAGMARIAGQNGYIVKAQIYTDQKTCVAQARLHLFASPVTAIADNSPYLKLWANRVVRSGEINFPVMSTEDPTNSTAASSIVTGNTASSNLPLYFGTPATDTSMWGILETLTIFTPASGQSFYVKLSNEDD